MLPAPPCRYVVLRHTGHGPDHFDLMFERSPGGDLMTWRSDAWPLADGAALTPLPDHRRAYLDYEGPVSGGRGEVARVAAGTFAPVFVGRTRVVVRLDDRDEEWVLADGGDTGWVAGRSVVVRAPRSSSETIFWGSSHNPDVSDKPAESPRLKPWV